MNNMHLTSTLRKERSPPEEELRALEWKENEQNIYGINKAASIAGFFLEPEWLNCETVCEIVFPDHKAHARMEKKRVGLHAL